MFFSTSNGYTEDSINIFNFDCNYLKSVDSHWDKEVSPAYKNTLIMNLTEFYKKLNIPYNKNLNIEINKKSRSGRILEITINNNLFKGTEIYDKLGLKSTDFTIELDYQNIKITTLGYGHGVGMSQYGALGMAKEGYNYKEILNHYYKNTILKKLN